MAFSHPGRRSGSCTPQELFAPTGSSSTHMVNCLPCASSTRHASACWGRCGLTRQVESNHPRPMEALSGRPDATTRSSECRSAFGFCRSRCSRRNPWTRLRLSEQADGLQ